MTLYCNPSENNLVQLYFVDDQGEIIKQSNHQFPRSEEILAAIDALTGGEFPQRIVCVNKAESFTLVRILATIYNSFAVSNSTQLFSLDEPLSSPSEAATVNHSMVKYINPQYSRQPNIS